MEVRRIVIPDQPRQKVSETLFENKLNKGGDVHICAYTHGYIHTHMIRTVAQDTKAGGLLEHRSSRPAWAM
jgi:hypothetical protein